MPRKEIEIKFRVANVKQLNTALERAGFRLVTPRTHEMNTLYDLAGQKLRRKGELLRLRKYGPNWVLTHKSKSQTGPHKARVETETAVTNGRKMNRILHALGFLPTFRYEKYRAEWTDGKGHVVIDQTPIGNFAEIEGPRRWIDRTARQLGVPRANYITLSYAPLFLAWKKREHSPAKNMTFQESRNTGAHKRAGRSSQR